MFPTGLERSRALCHGQPMESKNMRAGGCLWMAAILLGTFGGVAAGNPMAGVLIGTSAGGAIALAVWLIDRRRRGS